MPLRSTNKFVYRIAIKTKRCRFATSPCFVCFVRVEDGIDFASLVFPLRLPRGRFRTSSQGVVTQLIFAFPHRPTNQFVCRCVKKQKDVDYSTSPCFVCSGGRWCFYTTSKNLSTSIYRPFQPLFFTIWSHIGLRKIVPYFCKYNDSS